MAAKLKHRNGVYQFKPQGEMNIYNAAALKPPLIEALEKCKVLEIDLGGVSEIDSAGFQLLLLAKRETARRGKSLRLLNRSPAMLELLELYRKSDYFTDTTVSPQ